MPPARRQCRCRRRAAGLALCARGGRGQGPSPPRAHSPIARETPETAGCSEENPAPFGAFFTRGAFCRSPPGSAGRPAANSRGAPRRGPEAAGAAPGRPPAIGGASPRRRRGAAAGRRRGARPGPRRRRPPPPASRRSPWRGGRGAAARRAGGGGRAPASGVVSWRAPGAEGRGQPRAPERARDPQPPPSPRAAAAAAPPRGSAPCLAGRAGGHGGPQAGGVGAGRGEPLRRAASNKSWSAEYPHQSQHGAQQGVSHKHFQVQVLPGHQWSH